MSTDFLSEEELAELEAELADLEAEDEDGASEEALEETPEIETVAQAEPEKAKSENEAEIAALEADELEAQLNATEPETDLEPELVEKEVVEDVKSSDEAHQNMLKAKQAEHELMSRAEHEAKQAALVNTTSATNSSDASDEFADMLNNASSSFNPRQLQKDLTFQENNLDDAFMSQAGMFAHYSGVAHRASRRYDQLSQQVKLVEAKLDQEIRTEASHSGEKLTEAAIKNRIILDNRHRKITERMLDAKAVAAMTKDACEAFKQRRDMLIQMGANVREEHKGELRMKAVQESRSAMQQRALDALNQG